VKEICFPKSCASIGVHGHGLRKMIGFLAIGEPCGSSSGMAGNKERESPKSSVDLSTDLGDDPFLLWDFPLHLHSSC